MPGIIAALIVTVCVWFLWQISEIVVLYLISLLMFYVIGSADHLDRTRS